MLFALIGDHFDGLGFARTLLKSSRHQLIAYHGPSAGFDLLLPSQPKLERIADLEELLADSRIEAVIVAGRPGDRAQQLRRALQSEHHVLCVHPADDTPNAAYEAAMIQQDTHRVLLPLMPEALHPGVARLASLIGANRQLGRLQLLEFERSSPQPIVPDAEAESLRPALPGWDVLRVIGGEIAEVSGLASGEHLNAEEPLVVSGRFERGGLFQIKLLPGQPESTWRLAAVGKRARAELGAVEKGAAGSAPATQDLIPDNDHLPVPFVFGATLRRYNEQGVEQREAWQAESPWLPVLEVFEAAVTSQLAQPAVEPESSAAEQIDHAHLPAQASLEPDALTWQTAIRSQELDDAVRRSVERGRTSTLEYPEATEEAGFKGTMTLVGCGLLWIILLLVILSVWFPYLGWLVVPVLVFFLGLQILRWFVKRPNHMS
jgi:predicted dehydrogenase